MALVGVNAPYLRGDYGHDLAPNPRYPDWPVRFSAMTAYRPIVEAAELGLGAIRLWLCENGEGIVTKDGRPVGVHPELIEAVKIVQEAAALNGVRVYWSLLDGNAVAREGDPLTRAILAERDAREAFAEHVVAPLVRTFDPKVTLAVEIVNEPETATHDCMRDSDEAKPGIEPVAWEDIGATLRTAAKAAAAERSVLVTSGTMHVFLPHLWKSEPGLSAIDVHVYFERGGLPPRAHLARDVGDDALLDPGLPLFAGEAGIPKHGEHHELLSYAMNAEPSGYDAVFLWQLEGDLVDARAPGRPFTQLGWDLKRLLAG